MSRSWSRWTLPATLAMVLTTGAITGLAATPAQAAHPGANGMLLVSGSQGIGLVSPTGTGFVPLKEFGAWDAAFSPDGASVAYAVTLNWEGVLRVRKAGGSDTAVASVPGYLITSLSWSPDGKRLAFVAAESSGAGERIYRVGSDGTGLTMIRDLGDEWNDASLDWHPSAELLAVTWGRDVWTMDPSGASVTQWTQECAYSAPLGSGDESCAILQEPSRSYRSGLSWLPSGTGVLVAVTRSCLVGECPTDSSLSSLPVGGTVPTPVIPWPRTASGSHGALEPVASPDGTRFAYQGGDDATMVGSFAGGSPVRVGTYRVHDWQPCPGGTCASFAPVAPKPPVPRVAVSAAVLDAVKGRVAVPVRCATALCIGKVTLKAGKLVLGGPVRYLVMPGKVALVRLPSSKAAAKVLARATKARPLKASLVVTVTGGKSLTKPVRIV